MIINDGSVGLTTSGLVPITAQFRIKYIASTSLSLLTRTKKMEEEIVFLFFSFGDYGRRSNWRKRVSIILSGRSIKELKETFGVCIMHATTMTFPKTRLSKENRKHPEAINYVKLPIISVQWKSKAICIQGWKPNATMALILGFLSIYPVKPYLNYQFSP